MGTMYPSLSLFERKIMILKHDKPIIGIDVDGTLRDLEFQIEKFLKMDHPDKLEIFYKNKDKKYRSLEGAFKSTEDLFEWMYNERGFELFGQAPKIHSRIIDDLNIFYQSALNSGYDVIISTVQRNRSVAATLFWLSRWGCRVQNIICFNSFKEKCDSGIDIILDDSPEVLATWHDYEVEHPTKKGVVVPSALKVPYAFTEEFDLPAVDTPNGKFDDIYEILHVDRILKLEGVENDNKRTGSNCNGEDRK
jgi:hypothetical protein